MYTVVIVDDEKIMRSALASYVNSNYSDFEVAGVFADGVDALDYISVYHVDLVITDIRMHNMSGLDLARIISGRYPDCHIIIISGYNDFAYAKEAMKYGVQSYILKPIDFEELAERLSVAKRMLDRNRALAARETDLTNENASLFFIYILSGIIKSPSDIEMAADKLSLPFSMDSPVWVLELKLYPADTARRYGREEVSIALANILRMRLSDYFVYYVYKRDDEFFFVVTGNSDWLFDTRLIEDEINSLLDTKCALARIHKADSVFQLAEAPADEWFIGMMRESVSPRESGGNLIEPEHESDKELLVQGVKDYVQRNYARDISREDAANSIFLSATYMSRVFKTCTGMSFIDYLTMVRMSKAVELVGTNARISDIAERVGYHSRNTFLVNFRRYTSYTPTEYRRKVLKLEDHGEEGYSSIHIVT